MSIHWPLVTHTAVVHPGSWQWSTAVRLSTVYGFATQNSIGNRKAKKSISAWCASRRLTERVTDDLYGSNNGSLRLPFWFAFELGMGNSVRKYSVGRALVVRKWRPDKVPRYARSFRVPKALDECAVGRGSDVAIKAIGDEH